MDRLALTAEKFLQYLRAERNYAAHTLRAYRTDLAQFAAFLRERHPGKEYASCDRLLLREYLGVLQQRHRRRSSVVRKVASLRSLYKYLLI